MKLKNLKITNFRCFKELSIDLDEKLTVLVAKNGQGKSTLLDALRIGLWPFVSGIDLARNPGSDSRNNIGIDDVRMIKKNDGQMVRQLPCKITMTVHWDIELEVLKNQNKTKLLTLERIRESEARGSKTKDKLAAKIIKILAFFVQDQVREAYGPQIDLPILGYYGTGRLWSQKRLTEAKTVKSKKESADLYMRLFAYRDCLDPASSYKHFADWFTWIFESYREEQIKKSETGLKSNKNLVWENTIRVVQEAIDNVLKETGWHSLEYSYRHEKSLVLNHEQNGVLKVELLSDGIRGVLAMVGDIAYRCIKLNPHLGLNAGRETQGIVMIDEVDMHLHPAWQQTILGDLMKAFPNIQFIVTTHSPQVISTVPGQQIRILDGNNAYTAEATGTQGAESSRILKRIFDVDPRPQKDPNTQLLNSYLDLVYKDKWMNKETKDMRLKLDALYEGNEPALTEADLYIENRQW